MKKTVKVLKNKNEHMLLTNLCVCGILSKYANRGVAQFGSALGSGANHRFPFCEFPKRREPLKTLTILVVTNLIKIPM